VTTNERLLARAADGSRSEKYSIGSAQLGPSELATQHRELVTKHDDLELLELLRTEGQRRELQKAPEHEVAERPEQERLLQVDGTGDRLYGRKPGPRRAIELMQTTGSKIRVSSGNGGGRVLELL
jgi:hypothetical protein